MSKGRHEPHDVDAPTLHRLGAIGALVLVLVLCLMYVLWEHVHSPTLSMPPPVLPPAPRLQADAPPDRVAQYRLQTRQLESYGWVEHGSVAHIPIERAMHLLVARDRALSTQPGPGSSP
ncbi:hypothetical protein ISP15_15980 [Dyella jejuensis]|uniref:DUF4124 domain-containing protein n=1 Tax=Dyella jejuensis TaxID=1432009 RepID=A0ABW8JLX8_9GAMM